MWITPDKVPGMTGCEEYCYRTNNFLRVYEPRGCERRLNTLLHNLSLSFSLFLRHFKSVTKKKVAYKHGRFLIIIISHHFFNSNYTRMWRKQPFLRKSEFFRRGAFDLYSGQLKNSRGGGTRQ